MNDLFHYETLVQAREAESRAVAARERALRATRRSSSRSQPGRRVAHWVGAQLTRWGRALQDYGARPRACEPSLDCLTESI